jgi:hypothetical protein
MSVYSRNISIDDILGTFSEPTNMPNGRGGRVPGCVEENTEPRDRLKTAWIMICSHVFPEPRILRFMGIVPDDISESHSTEFEAVAIKSRSSPHAAYGGSTAREISFSFQIHEDYLNTALSDDGAIAHQKREMQENRRIRGDGNLSAFVAEIKHLTYPKYEGYFVYPPKISLKIGDDIMLKGYTTSVSVSWKPPIRNGRYIVAEISLSFVEVLEVSFSAEEIFDRTDIQYFQSYLTKKDGDSDGQALGKGVATSTKRVVDPAETGVSTQKGVATSTKTVVSAQPTQPERPGRGGA